MRACPLVGPLVGPWVGPPVGTLFYASVRGTRVEKGENSILDVVIVYV